MTRVAADQKHWSVLQGLHVCGILINIGPGVHWTCIVTHVGHTFYVDSQQFPPSLIDEENFRSILAHHPDAYFVMMHEMDEDILKISAARYGAVFVILFGCSMNC